jgi:hypothetical protein
MEKKILGAESHITFPTLNLENVLCRVDTGASSCSLGVRKIKEVDNRLHCTLENKECVIFDDYKKTIIKSSFGHTQERYVVKLTVIISGVKIKTPFTLSDRSKMKYPVLIGRKLLNKRFVVDVSLKN